MLMSLFLSFLQFLDAGKAAKRAILSNGIGILIVRVGSGGIGAGKRALVYFSW